MLSELDDPIKKLIFSLAVEFGKFDKGFLNYLLIGDEVEQAEACKRLKISPSNEHKLISI